MMRGKHYMYILLGMTALLLLVNAGILVWAMTATPAAVKARLPFKKADPASRFEEGNTIAQSVVVQGRGTESVLQGEGKGSGSVVSSAAQTKPGDPSAAAVSQNSARADNNDDCVGDVHIFYYPWYGNPETDGEWIHWNHELLPHWTPQVNAQYNIGSRHVPPDDIGSVFYPRLGPYSTMDGNVLRSHFTTIKKSAVDVVVVSWSGIFETDAAAPAGLSNRALPGIMQAALDTGVKIIIHIEPYQGRSAATVRRDVQYLVDKWGDHPAFYRDSTRGGRPMYYIYDSYHTPATEWASILSSSGSATVRGTKYDGLFISLYLGDESKSLVTGGGFDGIYTYFASTGFTKGSTPSMWKSVAQWCALKNLIFIPSVGPGYDDTRVRPWNGMNTKSRAGGSYYRRMFEAATALRPPFVSITSFNEWHEGTQVEPSIPFAAGDYTYQNFSPESPDFYMDLSSELTLAYREGKANPPPAPELGGDREGATPNFGPLVRGGG